MIVSLVGTLKINELRFSNEDPISSIIAIGALLEVNKAIKKGAEPFLINSPSSSCFDMPQPEALAP